MCSSPRNPNRPAADAGDRLGTAAGWAALGAVAWLVAWLGARTTWAPAPGVMRIQPETILQIAFAPAPEIAAKPEPAPKPVPEPAPAPEVVPAPAPPPSPVAEAVAMEAAPPVAEPEGDAGVEEAIRAEWLGELRRRIEQNKYYPGAARYSRETGTVRVRVAIGADGRIGAAEIRESTGSPLLAEGARGILRRAAAQPLGTNALQAGFQVEVPITYKIAR